jgi:hypothetical protein
MTVYERDGHIEHAVAQWPFKHAGMPPSLPMGASIEFSREGDKLVLTPTGGKVTLDLDTIRALGGYLTRIADQIGFEIAGRSRPSAE